jgi:hypothetical protein
MRFHPNGAEIPLDVASGDVLPLPSDAAHPELEPAIKAAIDHLIRPKAAPFVRAWMAYAKPQNLERFVGVLRGIHASSVSANMPKTMATTYMEEVQEKSEEDDE